MRHSLSEADLFRLADLNLVEFWRESSRWVPGSEIVEGQDTVFISAASDFPGSSMAFNLATGSNEQPESFLSKATAFFSGRKQAFSLILRGHQDQAIIQYCKDRKIFLVDEEQPGMVLDGPAKRGAAPAGAELRWVDDDGGVRAFRQVVAEAFEELAMPVKETEKTFSDAGRVLSPFTVLAVVYFKGEPSCAALAMLSHGIAGVYWVGTIKKARGNGLAQYCVSEVSNSAFDLGARRVVLQASKFGSPIYPKVGYRKFTTYPWFICSSKPSRS